MKLEGFDIRTIHPTGAYSASRYRLARIRVDERAKEEQHFYIFFGQDPKAVCIRFGERSRILSLVSEIMKQYCIIEVQASSLYALMLDLSLIASSTWLSIDQNSFHV